MYMPQIFLSSSWHFLFFIFTWLVIMWTSFLNNFYFSWQVLCVAFFRGNFMFPHRWHNGRTLILLCRRLLLVKYIVHDFFFLFVFVGWAHYCGRCLVIAFWSKGLFGNGALARDLGGRSLACERHAWRVWKWSFRTFFKTSANVITEERLITG